MPEAAAIATALNLNIGSAPFEVCAGNLLRPRHSLGGLHEALDRFHIRVVPPGRDTMRQFRRTCDQADRLGRIPAVVGYVPALRRVSVVMQLRDVVDDPAVPGADQPVFLALRELHAIMLGAAIRRAPDE